MSHLEPTYLRYIYDGLVKGSIHPENAAELPDGLIGLYEEAFDERTSVVERQKLLQRFAIWALLKKEVSAAFMAQVLGETEDEIQDFISKYSAWFNSPESGKYQLYHERLKVYLLQKLSEGEVAKLNTLIVDYLVQKANEVQQSESLNYCFENLSFHLFLNSYLTGNSELLARYCLDDNFKKRQFELSGFYEWEEKMMVFGVEYFSLKQEAICHQVVFEKTKIQSKKKDIDLIISLIRTGEIDIVFRFFQISEETELYARIELAYFYFLSFFEIFEKKDWNFIKKKEVSSRLLEIFEDNFQWDKGYYLSQFVDVDFSFRLHCYFEQFGLNFDHIAKLSVNYYLDGAFELACDGPIKFIDEQHLNEAVIILRNYSKYDYGGKGINPKELKSYSLNLNYHFQLNESLKAQLECQTKRILINDFAHLELFFFEELLTFVYQVLKITDIKWNLKNNVLRAYREIIDSSMAYSIDGVFENREGKKTLEIVKKDIDRNIKDESSLPILISNGLNLEGFLTFEPFKQHKLLFDENLDCDEDIELMLFLLELSEHYQKEESSDLQNLLSALLIEFHLDMNEDLIDLYVKQLIELIESQFQEASEDFESKLFLQIIDFLVRNEINGHRRKTAEKIKDLLLEKYFDFNLYKDSFISGCKLINLFSKLKIDFPEEEIVERILEDLNYLIEENDYNELQEIDCSFIDDIYRKEYFLEFYNNVKRIQIEEVRNNLSEYIFKSILEVKGLNHNTVYFFKENSNEYPGMYLWVKKRLSLKLLEQNEELSYVTIKDNNDLLLERLLLNIVSKRENLKDELNIQILIHYGLNWVIELDNEYEKLISTN